MNERKEPSRQPDQLEDTLQDFYQTPAPPVEFVERLEQQLRAQHPALTRQQRLATSAWSRFNPFRSLPMLKQHTRTFVSTTVGLILLFTLIVGAMALFSSVSQPTAFNGTPTPIGPQLRLQGNLRGPDNNQISFSIRVPQPHFPDQVPLYNIQSGIEQTSVDAARHWAEQFGLKSVRVYRDSAAANDAYIAQGADGRLIRIGPDGVVSYEYFSGDLPLKSSTNTLIDPVAALAAAQAFLKSIPELIVVEGDSQAKIELRVEPEPHQNAWTTEAVLTFRYVPVVDGIPVLSSELPGQVVVDHNGQVRYATLLPLRLKSTGKLVTLWPAETVLQEFVAANSSVIRSSGWGGSSSADAPDVAPPQSFSRQSILAVGDEIKTQGYVQHWLSADGGPDRIFLGVTIGQVLVLESDGLDLVQSAAQRTVSLTGRIVEQIGAGLWRVRVTAVQPLAGDASDGSDSSGTVRRQADGVWLETASGQKYLLPDVPADMADGTRVEVPGVLVNNPNQAVRLEWSFMTRSDETQPHDLGVSAVAEPVGVSRSVEVVQSVTTQGASEFTPTLPAWWTYQAGEEVTLEGEFTVYGYRTQEPASSDQTGTPAPERTVFEANLLLRSTQNPSEDPLPVILVGDKVNLDLLPLSGLSLRVQGHVLTAEEIVTRFSGVGPGWVPAVEITHYEKANPAEVKTIFSGEIHTATVDNRRVAIISDTLSQREYVVADSLTYSQGLPMYEDMFQSKMTLSAIGITAPDRTYGGYPIVHILESFTTSGNSADDVQHLRTRLENPVVDIGPASKFPADVVIDRIELVYSFQWQPAGGSDRERTTATDVVYHLTGHSSDNRYTVAYDLRATAEP